jgi:hypothetical protein
LNGSNQSALTARIHWETPLNIDLDINNKRQDCKIDAMCGGGEGTCMRGRGNEGD